jgi:hypothetical protein
VWRDVGVAVFGEIAVRGATYESRIAGRIEPATRFGRRGNLRRLGLATASSGLTAWGTTTLLVLAARSAAAPAPMTAAVAPIVEVAATISSVCPIAAVTPIALRVAT